jgi:DNA-binding XRE family transcriptional regulator
MDEELDTVLTAVGPRLRALRNSRGVTLAELSSATGISESTLSRLESGLRRPNLEQLLPWPGPTACRWTNSSARHPSAIRASGSGRSADTA